MQTGNSNEVTPDLISMAPLELAKWLHEEFMTEIPEKIETVEDLQNAGCLISLLTNKYSYLISMSTMLKIAVREEKRKKDEVQTPEAKISYENMVDRKLAVTNMAKIVKTQYDAIKSMYFVKKEVNYELGMQQ